MDVALVAYGGRLPLRNRAAVVVDAGVKRCSMCRRWLWVSAFGVDSGRADGFNSKCRDCSATYLRSWHRRPGNATKQATYTRRMREANPERTASQRLANRCRSYGITAERYLLMLEEQGGGCAICGKTAKSNGRSLAVDHDHACCRTEFRSCGQCVRGLLCSVCNIALGFIESSRWQSLCNAYLARRR